MVYRETSLDLCDGNPTKVLPPAGSTLGVVVSGLIQNSKENGHQFTRALREACSGIPQGPSKVTWTLNDATVTDPATGRSRTGDLVIEADYIFEGDATSPDGARARYHGTVNGVSGQLAGATGDIEIVTKATTTSSIGFYYAELRVPGL